MWVEHATSPRGLCILCLKPDQALTAEHLFPEAAGGRIMARILCQTCNSRLGQYIDAPFLQQKLVEMARVTYRLAGKTGKIPQPFSDTYSLDVPDGKLAFRLDENFVPRTIQQAPKISITENGEIKLELAMDARDRDRLPTTIRNTLTRFFRNDGRALGWTPEQQASAIQNAIDQALQSESRSTHISTPLRGRWNLDFQALYAELVKVIYEIGYLEFGAAFLDMAAANKLREFLLAQCADTPSPWTLSEMQRHLQLGITTLPTELDELTRFLCRDNRSSYHLGIASSAGVVCSLLNVSGIFFDADLAQLWKFGGDARVYVNSITDDDCGVFCLGEALERVAPGAVGP